MRRGSLVNCVAFARRPAWADEGWSIPAEAGEVTREFAEWAPEVQRLVACMERAGAYRWGLFGRPRLPNWHAGCIALLGDAAHPMLPFMGQGAAMAIEDGVVLGRVLAELPIGEALAAYERVRYPRATSTVDRANYQGLRVHGAPESVLERYVPDPNAFAAFDDNFEAAFDYDASTVPLPPRAEVSDAAEAAGQR
jgi:salicylate hydroxylase